MSRLPIELRVLTLEALLRDARDSVEFERAVKGHRDRRKWRELGGLLGRIDVELEAPVKAFNALACSVCGEPQWESPGGATCDNGHGGADGVEDIYG